ncbi:MAG: DUF2470 domain-containing protein [Burkholderiaceae bacterium]
MTKPDPAPRRELLQAVDDDARALVRRLVRAARFAAIAVSEPETGHALASRVAVATDVDGAPVILISGLSSHTAALEQDARCSLLLGEPRRGDPLAHPRVTLIGIARRLDRDSPEGERARARYLARHPKAALYADFSDFGFWRIEPQRASLNGGFGRAFQLETGDLLTPIEDADAFALFAAQATDHMNQDHADAVGLYATVLCRPASPDGDAARDASDDEWRIATIDPQGAELARGDRLVRLEFDDTVSDAAALRRRLVELAGLARQRSKP